MTHTVTDRTRKLTDPTPPRDAQCVIYLMSRDQRASHNWALTEALGYANEAGLPLIVVFILYPAKIKNTPKHILAFMLQGLSETAQLLGQQGIPFALYQSDYKTGIQQMIKEHAPAAIFCDYSPLRGPTHVRTHIAKGYPHIPSFVVDAHNIIPTHIASSKQEWAAYSIRPKIHRLLPTYLTPFPRLDQQEYHYDVAPIDWEALLKPYDDSFLARRPGSEAAQSTLETFVKKRLINYESARNDASIHGQSELSPYLHFGQISAQHVAQYVLEKTGESLHIAPRVSQRSLTKNVNVAAFLEELIVRRELAENYCAHNPNYDSLKGAPDWAIQTLAEHAHDAREFTYSYETFERAATHDSLWNAAQRQMVATGKMHGYIRMYWAKKILEWTPDANTAVDYAIRLNDTYELDGRDPNGYVGILWSIAGLHDHPWFNRAIFGTVRYMNESGMKRKMNTEAYCATWQ